MSEEEMTEAESAAFLRDLESRSKSKAKAAVEDDGEDVEAFLKRLEADEAKASAKSSAPKTKVKDPFEDEFAALKEAPVAEMVKTPEPEQKKDDKAKADKGKDDKKAKKDVRSVERGSSDGLKRAGQILKWITVLVPALVAIWLVGAFVAQWVSAGWLVALVALVGVLGVPGALRVATNRGGFAWWLAGFSIFACVGLTVPMTTTASSVVVHYGHWPASVLASAAGWDANHFTVRASQWTSEKLAGLVAPEVVGVGLRLGTEVPVIAPEPVPPLDGVADPTVPAVAPVAAPVAPVADPVVPVAAPVAPVAAPIAPPVAAPVTPQTAPVAPIAAPLEPTAPAVAPATPSP